ncbi:MAG TPA: PepSY-associated TM helix domain-containing protein [Oxalicibacterium sp.]|nr:PepSY-associated TM helix domain-containing protein [Oxalicibacterium sp.]
MRSIFVVIHRWFGLFIAGFLLIAGLTGALISWDHELDEWLNPQLFDARAEGKPLPPLALVDIVEKADPRARVSLFPLQYEEGHTAQIWVDARLNPETGRRYDLGYDHVFVDPVSGEIVGKRLWGKISLSPEHLMSFLYKLHFSLHLPEWRGTDQWGVWLMGIVALVWLVDTFVGFALTLPRKVRSERPTGKSWWQRWRPSWLIRFGAGGYRLNFDLHRAGGLWIWGIVLIIAFTSFSLNLYREVFYPVMSLVSKTTPGPFETRTPTPLHQPVEPTVSWRELLEKGKAEAARRGWSEPVGSVFYSDNFVVQGISFFEPGMDHEGGGMQVKNLYYDGRDGRLLGDRVPWEGTAADVFVQLQFPLHSGRILGMPGRILMSGMGLLVAMLSVTGIYIWWKKRGARRRPA